MQKPQKQIEFSRPVSVRDLGGDAHRQVHIAANEGERERLSARLGILGIDRLEADFEITGEGATVRAEGVLSADVIQACVVTLEPLKAHIEAAFERIYSEGEKVDDRAEVELAPEEGEPTEALVDGTFDAGEAVAEQLALELDPFPRAPNVEFQGYTSGEKDEDPGKQGPFSALARLKGGPGDR
jgi:uncharacterized metal-binding protein YceD (DUF177 family)